MAQKQDQKPQFPLSVDAMLAALAQLFAYQGAPREVAVLATASPSIVGPIYDDWGNVRYRLVLQIPHALYVQIHEARSDLERSIEAATQEQLEAFQSASSRA
jgi:hypothetical protein